MALVIQQTGSIQGNPNFHLFSLSQSAGVYHDITTGNNAVPCQVGTPDCTASGVMAGYNAGPGFDLATGWGSVDANALVTNWQNVTFKPTTVTGAVSPATLQHGTSVNLTASVSAGSASGTPTGSIAAYVVNGSSTTELGTASLDAGGVFAPTRNIPGGSGKLYFRYAGDGVFGASTSPAIPVTVTPEPSVITATPPSAPQIPSDPFTFPVKVMGQSGVGTPSGVLNVFYGTENVGTPIYGWLDSTGSTSLYVNFTPPAPGTYTLTISYAGDASFQPASTTFDVTYGKAYPSVLMSCDNGFLDIVLGLAIHCTTTVSFLPYTHYPDPTGSVQFSDGSTNIGAPVPLQSGAASLTISNLPLGSHTISGLYLGDANFLTGSWAGYQFSVVSTASFNWSWSNCCLSAVPGSPVQVSATFGPAQYGPNLTGTVTLLDGATSIATYAAPGNSRTLYTSFTVNTATSPMALGNHPLTLAYSGDAYWPAATMSTVQNLLISNPDFTITGLNPITVTRGQTALIYPTIRSIAGLSGSVALACSGAPSEATCTIGASATMGSTPSLYITTTAPGTARLERSPFHWYTYSTRSARLRSRIHRPHQNPAPLHPHHPFLHHRSLVDLLRRRRNHLDGRRWWNHLDGWWRWRWQQQSRHPGRNLHPHHHRNLRKRLNRNRPPVPTLSHRAIAHSRN